MELNIVFIHVKMAYASSEFVPTIISSISELSSSYHRPLSMRNIDTFQKFYSVWSSCTILLLIISHYPHNFRCMSKEMWSLNLMLSLWSYDDICKAIYTVLTEQVVNIKISSTVPVFYSSLSCNVTLCAVEHKKLWIGTTCYM
jgi:hypothetical protein